MRQSPRFRGNVNAIQIAKSRKENFPEQEEMHEQAIDVGFATTIYSRDAAGNFVEISNITPGSKAKAVRKSRKRT